MLKKTPIATAITLATLATPVLAESTDARIQRLEAELNDLKAAVEATAEAVEGNTGTASNPSRAPGDHHGHGTTGRTTIGGYGELHYNNWRARQGNGKKEEADFHRFILFLGHEFNEKIRFFSELEVEHALLADNNDGSGDTAPGEIALEQAYLEFDLGKQTRARGGILLMPVGFINETHEPPTFYGVERPIVEQKILPSTWYEAGASLSGELGSNGLSYDLLITTGLNGGTNIRGGRQKGAKATASDLAYTGRLKWTGLPGLELAGTASYQSDMTQDGSDNIGSGLLLTAQARYTLNRLTLSALYADWKINGDGAKSTNKDKQDGYYLEGSWKFNPKVGVYARYSAWDNGGAGDTRKTRTEGGVNWWPHEQVVIKADVFSEDGGDAVSKTSLYNGFDLGIGYMF
ncbi:MAG: porin [Gammaproteobacteria bacterium]|nr:MAG: porin [Gammaproteobacteria bacterium]